MIEIRQRWLDAGSQFAELGHSFQERYEGTQDEDVDQRLREAIGSAIAAVDEVLVAAGHALGDESLRGDAQRALSALHAALLVTFADASDELAEAGERLRVGLVELSRYEDVTG